MPLILYLFVRASLGRSKQWIQTKRSAGREDTFQMWEAPFLLARGPELFHAGLNEKAFAVPELRSAIEK